MRHLFMLYLLFAVCSLSGNAQDVIVKKDGSTVVCRIVELTTTEAVYQKWNASNNYNYVMNLSDIKIINYQDGRRWTSEGKTYNNSLTPQNNDYNAGTQMNEAQLYALDNKFRHGGKAIDYSKRAKRLKVAAWTSGAMLVVGGGLMAGLAGMNKEEYDIALAAPGFGAIGLALIITPTLLARANKTQSMAFAINSASIFEKEIMLRNGSRLRPGVDILSCQVQKKLAFGLGLRYSF